MLKSGEETDIFVSYSHLDAEWVFDWLIPHFQTANLTVQTDRDFEPGAPGLTEMERAVVGSRYTIVVFTKAYIESEWCQFENILTQSLDPSARRRRLKPVMREMCTLPPRLQMLNYVDFTREGRMAAELSRLLASMPPADAQPDASVPTAQPPHFAHLHVLQEHFTGRIDERTLLTEWWLEKRHPVMVLKAMGGMGKSALAWVWVQHDVLQRRLPGMPSEDAQNPGAYIVPEQERPEGLFWWSFYEREGQFAAFLDAALAYASEGKTDPRLSMQEKVRALVAHLQDRRLLLVLDGFERELQGYASLNAAYQEDDQDEAGAEFRACSDINAATFLAHATSMAPPNSAILLTSRHMPVELEGTAGCRSYNLDALSVDDAVEFFSMQGIRGTQAELREVCATYGFHPLSLRLLARLIVRDLRSPGDIAVADRYPVVPQLRGKEQHHILGVAFEALTEWAQGLLTRIAAFRSAVPYEALLVFKGKKQESLFDGALAELLDRDLLLLDHDHSQYDLHPVVRQYAYTQLKNKRRIHGQLARLFGDLLKDEAVGDTPRELALTVELYHHTLASGVFDEAAAIYDRRLYRILALTRPMPTVAITLLRGLFRHGEDNPPSLSGAEARARSVHHLAAAYSSAGREMQSLPLYDMLDAMTNTDEGRVVVAISRSLSLVKLGRLKEAEEALLPAIEPTDRPKLFENHSIIKMRMGEIAGYRGRYEEGEASIRAAISVLRRHDSKWECEAWGQLAMIGLHQKDHELAWQTARKARALADRTDTEVWKIGARWLLSEALIQRAAATGSEQPLSEAHGLMMQVLQRSRETGGLRYEADYLTTWARWHAQAKELREAECSARDALEIAERCQYRLNEAQIHNLLAFIALAKDEIDEARGHVDEALRCAHCDGPPYTYRAAMAEAQRLAGIISARQ